MAIKVIYLKGLFPHRPTEKTSQFILNLAIGVWSDKGTLQGGAHVTNIFVGNLSFQTTQADLEAAFGQYGTVERVSLVTDRDTGQPRGFAFVEMTDRNAAETAIAQLNGADLNGRAM